MEKRLLSAFRWFLLVCVTLNLGDAPYVDEILAEAGALQFQTAAAKPGQSAGQPAHDLLGKIKHASYEHLLSNIPLPAAGATTDVAQVSEEVPQWAAFFIPSPPGYRIERPPRSLPSLA